MVRIETYTLNNDGAVLYADREPTTEELFYINMHSFDTAAAYAQIKEWKLVRSGQDEPEEEPEVNANREEQPEDIKPDQAGEPCDNGEKSPEEDLLERRMQQIKKPGIETFVLPSLWILLAVFMICLGFDSIFEGSWISGIFAIIFFTFFLLAGIGFFEEKLDDYKLARSDFEAYKRKVIAKQDADARKKEIAAREKDPETIRKRQQEMIEMEYRKAVASQQASEPWTVRYSTHPCPYCGHYKVRYAKWEDKQLSVAFWGAASSAIDKHYKCEYCKKMW